MRFRASNLPLLVGLVLAMAIAVLLALSAQRHAGDRAANEAAANDELVHAQQAQDRTLSAYLATGNKSFFNEFVRQGRVFERAVAIADKTIGDQPAERAGLTAEIAAARHWQQLTFHTFGQGTPGTPPPPATLATEREAATEMVLRRSEALDELIDNQNTGQSTAGWIALGAIGVLGILVVGLGFAARSDDRRRRRIRRFGEGLQAARTEREAYELVQAHLERTVGGTEVAVFNRNNSADRLEATTEIDEDTPLATAIQGATPDDCLAVRTAKPSSGGTGPDDLLRCDICGKSGGESLCVPSIVGGEVIGSVLVRSRKSFKDGAERSVTDSVAEAAPVVAHLRNLAIAERRASSDKLTGLPNKRSADDTFKHMVANAARTSKPLALVLFDLDHFKRVNDTYGHPKGDEVLAAVGSVAGHTIRENDFAARDGGEEFMVLLPGDDTDGARLVAEKLRTAISDLRIPDLEQGVTASFGVASYPGDAANREELLRKADRALYSAKRAGRNRVVTTSDPEGDESPSNGNGTAAALQTEPKKA
jgi:diguanylate cyclase (GGDEF)-like protein